MANCAGCGRFVGDYSVYHLETPGESKIILCYACKRWADRHPGKTTFPPRDSRHSAQSNRVSTFATIYIISSFGIFALGVAIAVAAKRPGLGMLMILGALSLFFFGTAMRKFSKK